MHDRNNQYMLTISRTQLEKVRELIGPHMHVSMCYKLGLSYCNKNFDTITSQMNQSLSN